MCFDHAGVASEDAESLAFRYEDLFDCAVVHEERFGDLRVLFLDPEDSYFELLEPREEGTISQFLENHGPGLHHIALKTDDIEAALENAAEVGVELMVELRARDRTADEALLCDIDGYLAEAATSNLFFVSDGVVRTPAKDSLLPGITREIILEIADAEGLETERGRYTFAELQEATEAFLTNSTWELRPVASVDGVEVGGGPTMSLL